GSVLLYGQDVRTIQAKDLHRHVVSVPQTCELFYGSVRDNVCFGLPRCDDEQVWRALDLAQAGSFVRALPHQLDEQIERGGANLSGGQRQRLCIARALIRDPRILILDDASSALDFRTDAALRKGLREAFPQTTRLIVSQRAGTLCACDRILVMQDGVCVGFDTHARLYDDCAVYRGICQTQGVSREGVSA
ncbi:MAG: ATP-binding cassette domain-containing protein, partial [Merdibacter sp.]